MGAWRRTLRARLPCCFDFGGGVRQAAIRLSAVTRTGVDFYLKLPVEEFIALNNEVAEEWHRTKH